MGDLELEIQHKKLDIIDYTIARAVTGTTTYTECTAIGCRAIATREK